jgi:hypothetical protein
MFFQKREKGLVLEEDTFLKNLEIGFGFPEVIHLDHEERPCSTADLQL